MSERLEFVLLASQEGANISALCDGFGISRKTGYKWLARAAAGDRALADRSRRPRASPARTPAAMEARILELRAAHPAWGGRKLHHRLRTDGLADVPAPSTVTAVLRRHGLLAADRPRAASSASSTRRRTTWGRWTSWATASWPRAASTP